MSLVDITSTDLFIDFFATAQGQIRKEKADILSMPASNDDNDNKDNGGIIKGCKGQRDKTRQERATSKTIVRVMTSTKDEVLAKRDRRNNAV